MCAYLRTSKLAYVRPHRNACASRYTPIPLLSFLPQTRFAQTHRDHMLMRVPCEFSARDGCCGHGEGNHGELSGCARGTGLPIKNGAISAARCGVVAIGVEASAMAPAANVQRSEVQVANPELIDPSRKKSAGRREERHLT
eukprot:6188663-Pleurochrysis_carterae.AAC.2